MNKFICYCLATWSAVFALYSITRLASLETTFGLILWHSLAIALHATFIAFYWYALSRHSGNLRSAVYKIKDGFKND